MSIKRQFIKVLACSISLLFIANISLFFYFLNKYKNKTYQSLKQTLLKEKKDQLQTVMQNAHAMLDAFKYYEPAQIALANMRIGKNDRDHFFVIDQNGFFRVNPMRPEMVGRNYKNLNQKGEIQFIEKIISASDTKEGSYIKYQDRHSVPEKPESKLVFYKRFTKWNWIVCALSSIEDVENTILRETKAAQASTVNHLKLFAFGEMVVLSIGLLIIMRFFRIKLVGPIRELTNAATEMVEGNFENDINIRSNREIDALVEAMQLMQDSFAIAYERLKISNMTTASARANGNSTDDSDSYAFTKKDMNIALEPMG